MIEPKMCEKCGKACMFLPSYTNPIASEWYCKPCHKSYPVGQRLASLIEEEAKSQVDDIQRKNK